MKVQAEYNTLGVALLLVALVFLKFNAIGSSDDEEQTLVGTLVDTALHGDREVTDMVLLVKPENQTGRRMARQAHLWSPPTVTMGLDRYFVIDIDNRFDLPNLVGHEVEATGVIQVAENGNTIFLTNLNLAGTARKPKT